MTLLVLIHTVPPLVALFDRLAAELLPGVQVKHILDEPLLEIVRQRGGVNAADAERLRQHILLAQAIGAQAALVTCSTISPLVDAAGPAGLPVLKIDEAMLDAAVQSGQTLGVLATNPTTLGPTSSLLEARAAAAGRQVRLVTRLVPGALEALLRGDGATHDRLLRAAIEAALPEVDAIVLAQASMARVLEGAPAWSRPVLSSPRLALQRLAGMLGA
jgi:Asp/Glu/hydantoin racemase